MKPMLAGKYVEDKVEKNLPLYGQVKFDGIRVFIKDGIAWTRSLKPVRNVEFQAWVSRNKMFLEGLDGEIICGHPTSKDCYRRTMKFTMTYDADDMFTFDAFDVWNLDKVFRDRLTALELICDYFKTDCLKKAETELLSSLCEIKEFHERKMEEGHEGIILRSPEGLYKFGRSTPTKCECIKMKENGWIDTECRIIAFHEQMHNSNEAVINDLGYTERSSHKENLVGKDTLGSIEVVGNFEDGREFVCRVGTGLDDEIRQEVWYNQEHFKDKIVKIKYFNVGIKDKPRFPTFLGFRDPDDMDKQMSLFEK